MVLLVCAVFDSKVGAFMPVFNCKTRGEAIRSFSDACADAASPFAKHPADFRLFLLGEFDDSAGALSPCKPEPLIGADEIG